MCDKCTDIDEKVTHYRNVASRILDRETIDRIEEMIVNLLALKQVFHATPGQDST